MRKFLLSLSCLFLVTGVAYGDLEIEEQGPTISGTIAPGEPFYYKGRKIRVKGTGEDVSEAMALANSRLAVADKESADALNGFFGARRNAVPRIVEKVIDRPVYRDRHHYHYGYGYGYYPYTTYVAPTTVEVVPIHPLPPGVVVSRWLDGNTVFRCTGGHLWYYVRGRGWIDP